MLADKVTSPARLHPYDMNRTPIQLAKQIWLLPTTIVKFGKQRRRQAVLNGHEAERLDRIRNPSKYRGK
jgi:hypothetical protein